MTVQWETLGACWWVSRRKASMRIASSRWRCESEVWVSGRDSPEANCRPFSEGRPPEVVGCTSGPRKWQRQGRQTRGPRMALRGSAEASMSLLSAKGGCRFRPRANNCLPAPISKKMRTERGHVRTCTRQTANALLLFWELHRGQGLLGRSRLSEMLKTAHFAKHWKQHRRPTAYLHLVRQKWRRSTAPRHRPYPSAGGKSAIL